MGITVNRRFLLGLKILSELSKELSYRNGLMDTFRVEPGSNVTPLGNAGRTHKKHWTLGPNRGRVPG
jgi:hypothetical protein